MDEKQLEEFMSTGAVKRPVSLLVEGIREYHGADVPIDASEMECWKLFLQDATEEHSTWIRLAPALVIVDAIRNQTRTLDRLENTLGQILGALDVIYKGGGSSCGNS